MNQLRATIRKVLKEQVNYNFPPELSDKQVTQIVNYFIKKGEWDRKILKLLAIRNQGDIDRIRKEYRKIPIPKEVVEKQTNALGEARRKVTVFPDSYPPFRDFFTDEMGRLYVKTYEKDEDSGEHIFDIFNADGVFIGRKSLRIADSDATQARQNLLYCKNRKESGFFELVVYRMKWE